MIYDSYDTSLKEHSDELATAQSRRPAVCKGRACISGTRITVSSVLDNLADGMAVEAIVASYPPLTAADVHACMAYAAALAHEELVPLAA